MLTVEQARTLRRAGFVRAEIMAFDAAVTPNGSPQKTNLNTRTWRAAIASRQRFVQGMLRRGWTPQRIAAEIHWWYTSRLATSPWTFIQAEYQRPGPLTDYQAARLARARRLRHATYARMRRSQR